MNRSYLHYFFLLLIACAFAACSSMPDELKTAEQLIETAPDSALHILQHLSRDKYKTDASRALYGLLMIKTLDKKLLPLKPDSLLDFSIAYYQNHPEGDRLAECYLYKGRTYKYVLQYEKAMNFYLKTADITRDTKNSILLGRINYDMGEIYNIQKDYIQSRKKFYTAHSDFIKDKSQTLAFHCLLYIGETYHDEQNYEMAKKYYRQLESRAIDSLQKGLLFQDMGLNFYDSKQYDSAYYYLKRIINYPYIKNNKALRYLYLSNVYFYFEKIDSAYYYSFHALNYNADIRTQRECYRVLTNSEFRKGRMREMSMYMNKYVILSDSIRKIDAQIKGSYLETMYTTKKEVVKNKNLVWYLIGIILIVLIMSYLFYILLLQRAGKEKKHIQDTHSKEKASIRQEVMLRKKEMLNTKIAQKKEKLALDWKKADHNEREQINRLIYEEVLNLNNQKLFTSEMNEVLNNLISKLQTFCPSISEKEIIWCCLYLLEIPIDDIYILLDYKVESLRKMRQRLARKLNLKGVDDLHDFLIGIMTN